MPSSPASQRTTTRRPRVDPEQIRAQVLEAFSAKAKRLGFRALHMTELATELRISAATLYRFFPSKESLALACVERWADELGAAEEAKCQPKSRGGFEQYMHWVEAWVDANAGLSRAFLRDLQTDYPAVWQRYRAVMTERKQLGAALLRPLLKPNVDERVAFALLNTIFAQVLEPEFADSLNVSRRDALRIGVSIWAGGALARQGQLRSLRGGKKTKAR